jgi:hypothetical protein
MRHIIFYVQCGLAVAQTLTSKDQTYKQGELNA